VVVVDVVYVGCLYYRYPLAHLFLVPLRTFHSVELVGTWLLKVLEIGIVQVILPPNWDALRISIITMGSIIISALQEHFPSAIWNRFLRVLLALIEICRLARFDYALKPVGPAKLYQNRVSGGLIAYGCT
jgi:hypothetical protein